MSARERQKLLKTLIGRLRLQHLTVTISVGYDSIADSRN